MINEEFAKVDSNIFSNDALWRINPYIRRARYDFLDAHDIIGERIIYDYELLYIKEGTCVITIEDNSYNTQVGEIYIFKPGQRHSIKVGNKKLVQPHIHFDLLYDENSTHIPISFINKDQMTAAELSMVRKDVANNLLNHFPNRIQLKNTSYIEQMLFSIINTWNSPTLYPEIELKYRFLRLLQYLLSEITWANISHNTPTANRAKMVKLYLERYTDHVITLQELAHIYHLDKDYIARIFKATYKTTPTRYHLQIRILKAKEMIRLTNLSLSQISDSLGFNSLQDFSRAFKRIEGVAPSALRRNNN